MSIAQSFLAEFEKQAPITRRFLERLPADKLTWQPHAKSMTAGQLALHIATVPARLLPFVKAPTAQVPDFASFPQPASRDEILKAHDETVAAIREHLPEFNDAAMNETWRLMAGEREVAAWPRKLFLRDVMFSHIYQHRGQFGVYLRILNVPVPASFGPSADEPPVFMQQQEAVAV
jgi:uncharacterized damage-inducible protein DinB